MSYPSGTKHDEKLAKWTKLIEQCIQSGKSVTKWCKENGVCYSSYRYWQNRVCNTIESLKNISTAMEVLGDSAVAVSAAAESLPGFVQVNLRRLSAAMPTEGGADSPYTAAIPVPAMSIRIGAICCDIYNGADSSAIERAVLALSKIC